MTVLARTTHARKLAKELEEQGKIQVVVVLAVHTPGQIAAAHSHLRRLFKANHVQAVHEQRLGPRTLMTLKYNSGPSIDLLALLREAGLQPGWLVDEPIGTPAEDPRPTPGRAQLLLQRIAIQGLDVEAQMPISPELKGWLQGADQRPLQARLEAALRRRFNVIQDPGTTALRMLDSAGQALAIDWYAGALVWNEVLDLSSQSNPSAIRRARDSAVAQAKLAALAVGADAVFLKLRPQRASSVADASQLGLTPAEPIWGKGAARREILENGIRFGVHLGQGLGTGLYLDQRANRAWLRRMAKGRTVLNTFAYTCGFTAAAAVGGAAQTVSIDANPQALAQGRANLALNGIQDSTAHQFLGGDVWFWLPRLQKRGTRFDLIVLDPPSFSTVKGKAFRVQRDYPALVQAVAQVLGQGQAWLLCCANHTGFDQRQLADAVRQGLQQAGRQVGKMIAVEPSVDFPCARMQSLRVQVLPVSAG